MEINTIKDPMDEKIKIALNLINNLKKDSSEVFNVTSTQVNFKIKEVLQTDEIPSFIKTFRHIYEENANTFVKIYCINNFISNHFIKILENMKNNLQKIQKFNDEKFKYESFKNGLIGLEKEQIVKLQEKISEDILSYKEEWRKLLKEYKWRNNELLDTIIEYLDSLQKIMNNIKELSKNIPKSIIQFGKNENLFKKKETIKEGKYQISNLYRLNLKLLDEINEIFVKVKNIEEKRIKEPFNKLNSLVYKLKKKFTNIYSKINDIRISFNQNKKISLFDLDFKDLENINNDCDILAEKIIEVHEIIADGYKKIKVTENKIRLDIVIILDITSSMESYIENFKEQFSPMIENIRKECPEALVYVGFIGFKDLNDLELGDDYINIDLTTNYDKINEIINNIEPDGGDDIAEDIAGAFELCLKQSWKANTKIAFLITDSPCHGREYHELDEEQNEDKYLDEKPNGKKMGDIISEFFGQSISLFCLKLNRNTNKMFEKFKEKYDETKIFPSKYHFYIENNDFFDKEIIEKVVNIYKDNI